MAIIYDYTFCDKAKSIKHTAAPSADKSIDSKDSLTRMLDKVIQELDQESAQEAVQKHSTTKPDKIVRTKVVNPSAVINEAGETAYFDTSSFIGVPKSAISVSRTGTKLIVTIDRSKVSEHVAESSIYDVAEIDLTSRFAADPVVTLADGILVIELNTPTELKPRNICVR